MKKEMLISGFKHTINYDNKLELQIETVARLLAAYDEKIWNSLRPDRRRTYRRAASTLVFSWEDIFKHILQLSEKEEADQALNRLRCAHCSEHTRLAALEDKKEINLENA